MCKRKILFFKKGEFRITRTLDVEIEFHSINIRLYVFSSNSIRYTDLLYEMHNKIYIYIYFIKVYNGKNSIHRNNFSYRLSTWSK